MISKSFPTVCSYLKLKKFPPIPVLSDFSSNPVFWTTEEAEYHAQEAREPDMDRDDMFQKMFLI